MDLLKAYGSKRVAVRVGQVEVEAGTEREEPRGRFAKESAIALPAPKRRRGEDQPAVAKPSAREASEEEEDSDQGEAVRGLPELEEERRVVNEKQQMGMEEGGDEVGVSRPSGYGGESAYAEADEGEIERRRVAVRARFEEAERAEDELRMRGGPVIREVSRADQLVDQSEIQRTLHHEIAAPPASISETHGGRRKHQLSSMAVEANDNMALYEAAKLAGKQSKREARKKYGW